MASLETVVAILTDNGVVSEVRYPQGAGANAVPLVPIGVTIKQLAGASIILGAQLIYQFSEEALTEYAKGVANGEVGIGKLFSYLPDEVRNPRPPKIRLSGNIEVFLREMSDRLA